MLLHTIVRILREDNQGRMHDPVRKHNPDLQSSQSRFHPNY